MRDTSWMDRRECADADPELFHSLKRTEANEAKRFCERCPVRRDCLEYAIDMRIVYGIWGGLGYERRRKFANARP